MSSRISNVLFLCTGNSARSIMAEALLSRYGEARFRAFSAGSRPRGEVNPLAIRLLSEHGFPVEGLRSKSWDEFARPGAPAMDFIITVCDNAAGEVCPVWPGHPATAHWGVEDPAEACGTEQERMAAFRRVFALLEERVRMLVAIRPEKLGRAAMEERLRAIGAGDECAEAEGQ